MKKMLGAENVKTLNLDISKIKHFILEISKFKQLPGGAPTQGNPYINASMPISSLLHIKCHQCLGFFFWIPCSFSLILFLFTVHFCMHWMILVFMSKKLSKGNRALVSFTDNLMMFCIPSSSTDTSDQNVQ